VEKDKDLQNLQNSNEISIKQAIRIKKQSNEQEQEILSLREQISVFHTSIVNLESNLVTEKEVHRKENRTLSSQLENTIVVRQQLEAELIKCKGMHNSLQEDVNHLKAELLNMADEKKRYMINENCLQDERNKLLIELENGKEMLKNLSNDLHVLEDSNKKLNLKLVELQNQSEHMNEVNESLRNECEKSQKQLKELQGEVEQLIHGRLEHESRVEILRLENADLKAENNILSARATRLKEHLGEYTEVGYDDDENVGGHPQTADLWDLLASGMEQLKADLEIASKYAASIETHSLD
jgi:chromosome segregation ATPase